MSLLLGMAVLLSAASDQVLVSTDEVGPWAQLVDARDLESYMQGHLPGALHLDVDSLSETRDNTVGLLKPMSELKELFYAARIDPTSPVVVYSGLETSSELKQATRLFWILEYAGFPRVHLLDGGLHKWRSEGRPIVTGAAGGPRVEASAYESLKPRVARYASREDVLTMQGTKKGIIADLRADTLYRGEAKKDFIARGGHITGAENHPAPSFVDPEGYTFKGPEVIRDLLNANRVAGDTPVVTYCNTGRDATIGYVAYRIAGFKDVAVYDGSMAEWGNDATCPMSTTEK